MSSALRDSSLTPLKILHVCPRPNFSGLESYALQMAAAQSSLGHAVVLVVLAGSPLEARARDAGVTTIIAGARELAKILRGGTDVFVRTSHSREGRSRGGDSGAGAAPDIVHLHSTQDLDLMMVPLLLSRFCSRSSSRRPRVILQTHIWISHSKKIRCIGCSISSSTRCGVRLSLRGRR